MNNCINKLCEWANKYNLRIADKTEYQVWEAQNIDDMREVWIGNMQINRARNFKYLGHIFSEENDMVSHMESRLENAQTM